MSKTGQTIIAIQEYIEDNKGRISDGKILNHIAAMYGNMFVDIAAEYMDTMYDPRYDEMNDVADYEDLLEELGVKDE